MKRLTKSEIESRKKPAVPTATAADPRSEDAPSRPAVPYDVLLHDLGRAIDKQYARAPHLAVYEELGLDDPDRADPLNLRAAELFDAILQQNPEDTLALHHLAVIHHGMGFRLHMQQQDAVVHWRKGIQAWARLVSNDGFWRELRARWQRQLEANADDILARQLLQVDLAAFRRRIPRNILRLHSSLLRDCLSSGPGAARGRIASDHGVACEHMHLILESQFDAAAIESERRYLFHELVGDVHPLCDAQNFSEARDKVELYLKIDPTYVPAVCAGLQICCLECKSLGANGENRERRLALLKSAEHLARHAELVRRAESDRDILANDSLRDFHLAYSQAELESGRDTTNDMVRRSSAFDRALTQAQRGVKYEHCGHRAHEMIGVVCFWGAIDDINTRGSDLKLARRMIDVGFTANPQDADLAAVNAYYYLRREDEKQFREALEKAEEMNSIANSSAATKIIAQLQEASRQDPASRGFQDVLKQAIQPMQRGQFDSALANLKQLEGIADNLDDEDAAWVYAFKAECLYKTERLSQAEAALRTAKRKAGPGPSADLRNKLAALEILLG